MHVIVVLIPFIAGQWSLHALETALSGRRRRCLNPLHCGAVVASGREERRRRHQDGGLNPLHCGAVVASYLFAVGGWKRRPS